MAKNNFLKLLFIAFSFSVVSCNNEGKPTAQVADKKMGKDTVHTVLYTEAMVDNLKDPACGMPVKAGIGDTAHYKNHVIGFCSKECKATFLQNPEQFMTQLQLKTQ